MPRKSYDVPAVPGIDLAFRPASYWADRDPVSAIVQNIKGQNRREMARDFLAGGVGDVLNPIEDQYLEDRLDPKYVEQLGQIHPSFLGGEYLPDYRRHEVEIARVVLQSVTQDVYSVRARRASATGRIYYRIVDEYETTYRPAIGSSVHPLSLAQMVYLLDHVESDGIDLADQGLVVGTVASSLDGGTDLEDMQGFVTVESVIYAQLGQYYGSRLRSYLDEWARDNREEEEDDDVIV